MVMEQWHQGSLPQLVQEPLDTRQHIIRLELTAEHTGNKFVSL